MYKKPIRLPSSYMLILCSMHINCQLLDALLKNIVALKVLVWSRGRLVTLQILTSSSFSLVEETHGSLGQCVSFSLIDVGSGFTAYPVFFSFSFGTHAPYAVPGKAAVSGRASKANLTALLFFMSSAPATVQHSQVAEALHVAGRQEAWEGVLA